MDQENNQSSKAKILQACTMKKVSDLVVKALSQELASAFETIGEMKAKHKIEMAALEKEKLDLANELSEAQEMIEQMRCCYESMKAGILDGQNQVQVLRKRVGHLNQKLECFSKEKEIAQELLQEQNGDLVEMKSILRHIFEHHGNPLLHSASKTGDVKLTKILMDIGRADAEINAKDDHGFTALHKAVKNGEMEIAEILISNGANPESQTKTGETCIHLAAVNGHIELVEKLIKIGAQVDAKNQTGETPLHGAAETGQWRIAEILISNGATVDSKAEKNGQTPLHYAAKNGCFKVARILVDYGANVHDGVVNEAAANGHSELVEYLISQGADMEERSPSAVNIAIRNGHVDVIEVLLKKGADLSKLEHFSICQAIRNRHTEVLKYLISKGVQLEMLQMFLYDSVMRSDVETVEYVLELGADPKDKTMGRNPLCAAMSRYYNLQSLLTPEEKLKLEKIIALLEEKGF